MTSAAVKSIDELDRLLQELPLLPTVVARLIALDQSGNDYFDEVNELAKKDPPFASRLFRRANSACYCASKPVFDLH